MIHSDKIHATAVAAEKEHEWETASELFLKVAHWHKDSKSFEQAAEFFMRAAIARERCEQRRRTAQIWMHCASALENRQVGAVADVYDPLEASKHFFPTVDIHAWQRFTVQEKVSRAYRNAGYHLERGGSNHIAFTCFAKSGHAFREAKMFGEASRTYYRALLCFIARNGEVDEEILDALEEVDRILISEDERKYLKRQQLYYRGLAGALISRGNYEDAARFFCKEHEVSRRLAKKDKRFWRWFVYSLWKHSSSYGNSFWLWASWAFLLFIVVFPLVFRFTHALNWQEGQRAVNWLDYIFFSISTVTTAWDPSFNLSLLGNGLVMTEGMIGFLMLGSLLTLLAKKAIR